MDIKQNAIASAEISGNGPDTTLLATATAAPQDANGLTTAAESHADAILQAALDANDLPGSFIEATGPELDQQEEPQIQEDLPGDNEPLGGRYSADKDAQSASSRGDDSFGDEGDQSSYDDDDDEEENSSKRQSSISGARRKRRNILPRIMRGQRCGHCHTCLNPQMKKACLTMRQKQMKELQKRGELPVSMMAQLSSDGSLPRSGALPPPRPKPAAKRSSDFAGLKFDAPPGSAAVKSSQPQLDPFTREIQTIANRNGGVEARFLPSLQRLYQKEVHLERRLVLMTVLKQSPPGTLKEAVRNLKIITELQKWLQSAAETKEFRLAFRVIETLDKLPVDLTALQSTGIGKTLAKLRKSGPEELRKGADNLVSKWKKAVDSEPAAAAGPAKRQRDAADGAGQAIEKKIKVEEANAKTAKARPPDVGRMSAIDSKHDGTKASVPMEVDDTAMFERRKSEPSIKDTFQQLRKTHQIKVLNGEPAKKLKGKEGADKSSGSPKAGVKPDEKGSDAAEAEAQTAPAPDLKVEIKEEPSKLGSKPPPSAFAGAHLSMPLGSSRLSGTGTGITRIGDAGSSLASLSLASYEAPMHAPARAAAAAARIPDPPAQPRREKAKRVSWTADEQLVLVRWFRQVDPVSAVREDAKLTTEVDTGAPATAEEAHPPGFVSAAKREHQNEAAALRQHHLDVKEEAEDQEVAQADPVFAQKARPGPLLQPAMQLGAPHAPMVEWPVAYQGPPLAVNREAEYMLPKDEECQTPGFREVEQFIASRPAVMYGGSALVPESPAEPLPDTAPPVTPLSIPCPRMEPTPAVQPQPLLQQPPHGQVPAPLGPVPLHSFAGVQPARLHQPAVQPVPPPTAPFGHALAGFAPLPVALPQHGPLPRSSGHLPGLPPPAQPMLDARPLLSRPDSDRSRSFASRGRGRGRQGQGEDISRGGYEGGRGRAGHEGRGNRGRQAIDTHRRPGETAKPAHLVPCRWHFGGAQGCKNGDSCRFSHNPEHQGKASRHDSVRESSGVSRHSVRGRERDSGWDKS